MISLLNSDINTMSNKGCIEGFRILVHTIADSANTPLTVASHQPNYQNVDITIRNNNDTVYDGDLATFVDYLLNREYLFKKSSRLQNLQFLNANVGQVVVTAASGVNEHRIADLSVAFKPYFGEWKVDVRTKSPFKSGTQAGSYFIFDFNKSDEIGLERFKIISAPVTIAANFGLNIKGLTRCVEWYQSDNKFIGTNDGQFNSTNEHPIQNIQVSSVYAENMLTGAEMQVSNARGLNGVLNIVPGVLGTSVTQVNQQPLQKSIRLSDEEWMDSPSVNLKLASGSMNANIGYKVVYDLVVFDVTSAKQQAFADARLNPQHKALQELFKGQF